MTEAEEVAIHIARLTDGQVSRMFDVDRDTVSRWRAGEFGGHPSFTKHVLRELRRSIFQPGTLELLDAIADGTSAERTIVRWDKAKHL